MTQTSISSSSVLSALGIQSTNPGAWVGPLALPSGGAVISSVSPIDGGTLASLKAASQADYETVVAKLGKAFADWRLVPAPVRGQVVREIGDALRARKKELGALVTLESGKILTEGEGEIQEAIDIADFSVGLSRQLYGKTMHSERPTHRMYEQWHPLGIVGVITAFNFPAAVWAWNAMLAAVCGDVVLWKPSELTPLTALAMHGICSSVAARHGHPDIFGLVIGDGPSLGQAIAKDSRIPLVSATGSCRMGRAVGETVARRLGRSLLELGGNNAVIVLKDADLDLVVRSTVFGAVGTAGQRCTTTRRLFVEAEIQDGLLERMAKAYGQIPIGNPLQSGVLMGPLIHERAVAQYFSAIEAARSQGGEVVCGAALVEGQPSKYYVRPTIIRSQKVLPISHEETFAPILYVTPFKNLDEAIELNNAVPQGLSSAVFTTNFQNAERFLGHAGSDCGIANVNLGTSGAEIGGAFGGEKDTGGGRESGSDSWKQYMRRQTNTLNFGSTLPLAQGIKFDVGG
jgi:aldehyde dehydrogenase (NAD+)